MATRADGSDPSAVMGGEETRVAAASPEAEGPLIGTAGRLAGTAIRRERS